MKIVSRAMVVAGIVMFFLLNFPNAYKFNVGAIVVGGNSVQELINGVFEFSDDIIVEGNATLLVENATIRFVQVKQYEFELRLQNPSNGNPRLIVKNGTFQSTKPFKVSLWGNSSADCYGLRFPYYLELFDSSTAKIFDKSSINYIRSYGSSNVSVFGSDAYYLYAHDDSYMRVSASVVNRIESYDRSKVNVSISTVKYSVAAYNYSQVFISGSSFSGSVLSNEASTVLFLSCFFSKTTFKTFDYSNLTLSNSTIITSRPPSDFSLKGCSSLFIYGSQITDVSLLVYENSTIDVQYSNLTFVYVNSFENSVVQVLGSTIDWLIECAQSSLLHGINSSFTIASGKDSSNLFFDNCAIAELRCFASSNVAVSSCTIKEVLLELRSVNLTFNNLGARFFDNSQFLTGSLNVNLLNTKIDNGWNLRFYGYSNVTIRDSEIINLGAYDSSRIWIWNTTFIGVNVKEASEVYLWSYLTVRVIDYFGNNIKGANVTVSLYGVPAESKVTGEDGVAAFELCEKFVNASDSYYVRNYEVAVIFDGCSAVSNVNLKGSQFSVFNFPSPWWYWHLIFGSIFTVVLILSLSALMIFKRRKKSKIES